MFLVELVMQGVRGFQQLVRLRFQGGFNLIVAGNEAGKSTAADTLTRLLFPVNDPGRMAGLISRATPDASRGAMVVFADDQSYYQVIQDFSKRAVNLSKHDPATKKFTLQYKDWNATAQFMTNLLPQISETDYDRIFVFRRGSCAGHGGASAGPGAATRPAAAAAAPQPKAESGRLAELRQTLLKAEEAADAEYKADSARIKLGELVKKLEQVEDSRAQMADLEERIAELKICETFPENLAEMISTHEYEQTQKMVKTDELDRDIEGLTLQRDSIPQANLFTDKLFIAGAALLGLSLVAGVFGFLSEDQSIFFLLGVFGSLLLIAAAWYNHSRKNAQRKTVQKEIDGLVKDRADVEKKFQDSGATILKFMKAAGVTTPGELKERADNYRHYHSLYDDLLQQQRLALGGQAVEEIQAEMAAQQQEVDKLEEAARALAKYAVDTYSVRQEIERLEAEASPGGMGFDFGGPDLGGGIDAPAPAAAAGFNMLSDVAIASRMSGIELETLVPAVESAAQRSLSTASGGTYVRVEIGPDGQPVVHDQKGGKHPFSGLSHGTRELVCFSLRAGLVEAIAGKRRLPFVLDDPFVGLDPARQAAACQVLRVLGTKTQVILLTSNPALRAPNEAAQELK
jgi:uncharacterized protein YhaN